MITRAFNNSKIFFERIWHGIVDGLREFKYAIFPFLRDFHISEYRGNDYTNKRDYLFIPELFSTKNYWFEETISLAFSVVIGTFVLLGIFAALLNTTFLIVVTSLVALTYFFLIVFKLYVVYKGFSYPLIDFTDEEINALKDEDLPVYTILVPLLNESEVMGQIISALSSIDYPASKLNLIITMHDFDRDTVNAFLASGAPEHFKVHLVPNAGPKTKPKDLNTAFKKVEGEYFVIYDAEILPDTNQLKKAVLAFKHNPDITVLQTRLDHYNADQNILTRLFNMEFSFYYDYFLPGLQKLGFPIPLSGHSTHFRTKAVRDVGAWDAYNVAEDCEIGMRLFRAGHKTAVMNSLSQEEAASSVWSWVMQRTRWMKGFIQTSIVHLRQPLRTKDDMGGWKNFGAFLFSVPGTVMVNFLNLFSWLILVFWLVTKSDFVHSLYTQPILYIAVIGFVVGLFVFSYLNLIGSYKRKRFHIVKYGLLTPLYWMLLAFATTRAVYQTFTNPFSWEKTTHGTHLEN